LDKEQNLKSWMHPFLLKFLKGKSKYHVALQFSQVMNMFVLALIVPYLIGLSEYGYYASLYSIPGFFQGMLETYLMLLLFNNGFSIPSFKHFTSILFVSFFVISILVFLTLGKTAVFTALILYLFMVIRSIALALAYHCLKIGVFSIIVSELIVFLVYSLIILDVQLGSQILGFKKNFLLPLSMICIASIPSSLFLLWKIKPFISNLLTDEKDASFDLRNLLARIYEDLFFSLAPLVTFKIFGSKTAGEYRLILSIFKGISKIFPFKYELLLRNLKEGDFSFSRFKKLSFLFIILGFTSTFILIYFINLGYFPRISHLYLILLSSGFVITLLVVYPYAITKIKLLPLITVLLYFFLYLVSYFLGIKFFVFSFVLINSILYLIVYKKIIRTNI
jgi:hypothetical protein